MQVDGFTKQFELPESYHKIADAHRSEQQQAKAAAAKAAAAEDDMSTKL